MPPLRRPPPPTTPADSPPRPLGAVAFLGLTALDALPPRRGARAAGLVTAGAAVVAALVGLRVGAGAGALVPTAAVALAGAAALGAGVAFAWTLGARGAQALAAARAHRDAAVLRAGEERRLRLAAARQAHLAGHDLHAEVEATDATVARLRAAVDALAAAHAALQAKLTGPGAPPGDGAAEGPPPADAAPALTDDLARASAQAAERLDLGRRVLEAAEAAALRVACNEPLRRLLRRRPRDATQALSAAPSSPDALRAAATSLEAFLGEVRAARREVADIARRRAGGALDEAAEGDPAAFEAAEGGPAARAQRELDAMGAAYGALLERLHVAEIAHSTRAGVAEVERAAGALSQAAGAAAIDPAAIDALVTEVARAEAAVALAAPEGGGSRALAEALAAGSAALDRSDAASLHELLTALHEVR
jgi:hypothetical protein